MGLLVSMDAFHDILFAIALLGTGYGVKIAASWGGARLSGFSSSESFKMGLVLNSRGTFDLIVANLALAKGYIDSRIFSVLIVFGVFSVVFNPIIYRRFYYSKEGKTITGIILKKPPPD